MPFGVPALPFRDRTDRPAATVIGLRRLAVLHSGRTGRARQHGADAGLVQELGAPDVVEGVGKTDQRDSGADPAAIGVHGLDAFLAVRFGHQSADVRPRYGAPQTAL